MRPNPFRGLRSYLEEDRARFFGRDRDLILMRERIASGRTVLFFAGSGVGKTSFLRARLIPDAGDRGYECFYWREWASRDCTERLRQAVASQVGGPEAGSLPELLAARTGPEAGPFLLILDQFEEVFQHHAYEAYFRQFVGDLAQLVNDAQIDARVLVSMREEFLGELSAFDNRVPDLFGNYFRLKNPSAREAREIIRETAGLSEAKVDVPGLEALLEDLRRIEKGAGSAGERAPHSSREEAPLRDFVLPPYLQIACQRLWNGGDVFLAGYRRGQAREALHLFLGEQLASLSPPRQELVCRAADYLVTRQGAKMAYELDRLAEHMRVDRTPLGAALSEISVDDRRILRESAAPDGSCWYELYHDVYGPFLDQWARDFRRNLEARRMRRAVTLVAVIAAVVAALWGWDRFVTVPRQLAARIKASQPREGRGFINARQAYAALDKTWGWRTSARRLWGDWWERRSRDALLREHRDEAILALAQAIEVDSGEGEPAEADDHRQARTQALKSLLADDGETLVATFQPQDRTLVANSAWSTDEKVVLTATRDGRIHSWSAPDGALLGEARVEGTAAARRSAAREQEKAGGGKADRGTDIPRGGLFAPDSVARHPEAGLLVAGYFVPDAGESAGTVEQTFTKGGDRKGDVASKPRAALVSAQSGRVLAYLDADGADLDQWLNLSRRGDRLVTVAKPDRVAVWQIGAASVDPPKVYRLPGALAVDIDPSGSVVAAGAESGEMVLWDAATHGRRSGWQAGGPVRSIGFSPDGQTVLVVAGPGVEARSLDGQLVWRRALDRGEEPLAAGASGNRALIVAPHASRSVLMSTRIPSTEAPPSLRYVPRYWGAPRYINLDGTRLLFTTNDVAQLRTADALFQKDPSGLPADWGWLCADGQSFLVQRGFFLQRTDLQGRAVGPRLEAGTVSEDGRYVAVRRSTAVEIFDTASGETRSILLTLVPGEITALHGDRDGRHFAVADGNRLRVVVARSTSDASPVAGTVFDTPSVRSPREKVAFSPDGRYLAAITAADASAEGVLHLVEVGTGRRLDVPKGRADDFAFSPDAILVAGAESVQIWDLARETVRGELRGPGNVKDIVVSPDGQHGLTVGADNRLTAWDLASGESGKPVELPSEPWRVAFAPAGDRAVVFSGDWVHLLTVDWLHLTVEGSTRHAAARWSPFESLGWPVLLDGGKGVRFLDRGTAPGTVEVRDLRFEGEPVSTTEKPALPTRKELERRLGLQFETALGALVSTGATRAVPAPPNPADPVQAEAALE